MYLIRITISPPYGDEVIKEVHETLQEANASWERWENYFGRNWSGCYVTATMKEDKIIMRNIHDDEDYDDYDELDELITKENKMKTRQQFGMTADEINNAYIEHCTDCIIDKEEDITLRFNKDVISNAKELVLEKIKTSLWDVEYLGWTPDDGHRGQSKHYVFGITTSFRYDTETEINETRKSNAEKYFMKYFNSIKEEE